MPVLNSFSQLFHGFMVYRISPLVLQCQLIFNEYFFDKLQKQTPKLKHTAITRVCWLNHYISR